jgi:DNA-binding NtrC family response regulator
MKPSILYLDDEVTLLQLFKDIFSDEYDIRTTNSPADARRMISERAADIIITDQRMPEIEGTEFLREAAELCPESYRILLTGNVGITEIVDELSTGIIQAFLPKPWMERRMRRAFERALVEMKRDRNT